MSTLPKRLLSIDVFRSITMFFMIFVNDLSGVKLVPKWIDHVDAHVDGMGFADTIFPAFLFIVGLSLPFALQNKISRGATTQSLVKYITYRGLALLVMGFYQVNMESYDKHNWFPLPLWAIISTLAFFVIWLDYSPNLSKRIKYSLITFGWLTLVVMAIVYKGVPEEGETYTGMHPQWWGILGIIGWSYLVAAFIYVFTKGNIKKLCWALAVFVVMDIVLHTLSTDFRFWLITDGSSVALVMAGVLTSAFYSQYHSTINKLLLRTTSSGVILVVLGLLIRPYSGGISKIYSTPAWVFICAGISLIMYSILIWLIDLKDKQNWFSLIRPAGTSTLTCYLIPYLLFFSMLWADFEYPDSLNEGIGGIIRSFGISFLVILIVRLLEKIRLRLKV